MNDLSRTLLSIRDLDGMKEFLRGLFTEKELVEITKRIQIVKMLKSGVGQHEIAKKLGVGVATVTRGSKEIQKGRFIQI
jgi:TrpR family trp operon transcriptional repressor